MANLLFLNLFYVLSDKDSEKQATFYKANAFC